MKYAKRILIFLIIFIFGISLFYKFMTYDRNYTWAKIYGSDIEKIADSLKMNVINTERITVDQVKLPKERKTKLQIQKFLSKINLMNYSYEFGEKINLKSENGIDEIICKSWCLGDHLMGLEIEYRNIEDSKLLEIKKIFERNFYNYELVWTKE